MIKYPPQNRADKAILELTRRGLKLGYAQTNVYTPLIAEPTLLVMYNNKLIWVRI